MTAELRAPAWVVDLLLLPPALLFLVGLFCFLIFVHPSSGQDGGVLLIPSVVLLVAAAMLAVPIAGVASGTRLGWLIGCAGAVVLSMSVIFLPVGVPVLLRLSQFRGAAPARPAQSSVALLMLPTLVACGIAGVLGLAIAADPSERDPTLLALSAPLALLCTMALVGVVLGWPWARHVAALVALLTALTLVGLVFAVPALWLLWRSRPADIAAVATGTGAMAPGPPTGGAPQEPPSRSGSRQVPVLTISLIGACVAMFLLEIPGGSVEFLLLGGGQLPPAVALGGVTGPLLVQGQLWRLVTAGFLHAGVLHIGLNMVGLLYGGIAVEHRFGRARMATIYFAALIGSSLLAAAISGADTVSIGASGAILGLFAAMLVIAIRYWSERDWLQGAILPLLATLFYGVTHAGISNGAHVGGALVGFLVAWMLGPARDWHQLTIAHEAAAATASEHARCELERQQPSREAIDDPANRLVLRMGSSRILGISAAGAAFILVFGGVLVRILTLNRAATAEEVLFAILSLAMAVVGAVAIVGTLRSRLELTPQGFRVWALWGRGRTTRWIDVEDIRPYEISTGYTKQKMVGYRITPAARARARPGLASFLGAGQRTLVVFGGMTSREQAELMESWRQRWTM